jgi:Fic family protein
MPVLPRRGHEIGHPVQEVTRGFLTTSKYARIARCSADTALRDIGDLVERGVLVRNPAGGRSTSYRVAEWKGTQLFSRPK